VSYDQQQRANDIGKSIQDRDCFFAPEFPAREFGFNLQASWRELGN
jgi:hypothetical protein